MVKNRWALVLIGGFLAAGLAGCGDDSAPTTPDGGVPDGPDATPDGGVIDGPDPTALGFPVPDPEPELPAGVDAYDPPSPDEPSRRDTVIAEGIRVGEPGDTLVVTGDGFVPEQTRFDVFSQAPNAPFGEITEVQPAPMDALSAALLLPAELPAATMYLVYPRTGGRGLPFPVNRTAARWVGPNRLTAGDSCAVYGTNLSYGHGTDVAYVYLKPVGPTEGQFLPPTEVNPYRLAFAVPADASPGEHEVWVHNGHGGRFGWSGPLELEIAAASPWAGFDSQIFDVTDYGATGDGTTLDDAAIAAALEAAAGAAPATLYFPAGTYLIDAELSPPAHVRWLGDGPDQSILRATADFSEPGDEHVWVLQKGCQPDDEFGVEIADLTLDGSAAAGVLTDVLRLRNCPDTRISNVHLQGDADFHDMRRLFISDVVFDGKIFFGAASQVFVEHSTSRVGNHDDVMTLWGAEQFSLSHHVAKDFNASSSTTGISSGRFIVTQAHWGSVRDVYVGDSETIELAPSVDKPDQNSGEQILFEMVSAAYQGPAAPATETTVTLTGLDTSAESYADDWDVVVVQGKGLGQRRTITAVDEASSTVTVAPAFTVVPDDTSRVAVLRVTANFVVYRSTLQGKADYATRETASSGVQPYGNGFDIVVDGNTFERLGEPWSLWAMDTDHADSPLAPSYFNLFVHNTSRQMETGALLIAGISPGGNDSPIGLLGNCLRDNEFTGVTEAGIDLHGDGSMAFNVFDSNRFVDAYRGVYARRADDAPPGAFAENLLLRDRFERGAAPAGGSVGFESDPEPEISWVMTGNTFEGYESGTP